MNAPSQITVVVFGLLCAGIVGLLLAGGWRASRRAGRAPFFPTIGIGATVLFLVEIASVAASSGWLETQPMPRLMIFFAGINLGCLAAGLSPMGRSLANGIPLGALVAFQGFRLPLELILHVWAEAGVIPETMTWTGSNWDIVSGVSALVLAPFVGRRVQLAWVANLIGIALLVNVLRVVILSSPLPFAWPVRPTLQLAFHVPLVWIVPVCVGGAIFGHVVLTRALLRRGM